MICIILLLKFIWFISAILIIQHVGLFGQNIKETFTTSRPHIAESFVNRLMSTHIEDATSITFSIEHLTACVNQLASDIMSREKLVFEKYAVSQFYIFYELLFI